MHIYGPFELLLGRVGILGRERKADLHGNILQGHEVFAELLAHHALRETRRQPQVHDRRKKRQHPASHVDRVEQEKLRDEGVPAAATLRVLVDARRVVKPTALVDERGLGGAAVGVVAGDVSGG
eukprot:768214-Hanusia_phi.AAC.4